MNNRLREVEVAEMLFGQVARKVCGKSSGCINAKMITC
jgi:hypothetical protein